MSASPFEYLGLQKTAGNDGGPGTPHAHLEKSGDTARGPHRVFREALKSAEKRWPLGSPDGSPGPHTASKSVQPSDTSLLVMESVENQIGVGP